MASKRRAAYEVARRRSATDIWIDHAFITESDFHWLEPVERLVLWNVKLPDNFLARLPHLKMLDVRGGTAKNTSFLEGLVNLQVLVLNQIRGVKRTDEIAKLTSLRYLQLYGFPKIIELPNCEALIHLERASLGSLKRLKSLSGLLKARSLSELEFVKAMGTDSIDTLAIRAHPSIERFTWFAENVPDKVWLPVNSAIALPDLKPMQPADWYDEFLNRSKQ